MVVTMANAASMAKTTLASCSMQHHHAACNNIMQHPVRELTSGRRESLRSRALCYPDTLVKRDNKCDVCGHLRHARRAVIRVASAASVIVEHRAQSQQARFGDAIHVIKSWTTSTTSTCKSTCTMCIVLVVIQAQRSAAAPLTPFQCERCVVLRFVACM